MSAHHRADFLQSWIGIRCSGFSRHQNCWRVSLGDTDGVTIECPWRIISGARIILCASDDEQQFGLSQPVDAEAQAKSLIVGTNIRTAEIMEITSDLRITFETGIVLELLNNSSGYEAWQARVKRGEGHIEIVAMGGGKLVVSDRI